MKFIKNHLNEDFIFTKERLYVEVNEEKYKGIDIFPDGLLIKGKYRKDDNGRYMTIIDCSRTNKEALDYILSFNDSSYFIVGSLFLLFSY